MKKQSDSSIETIVLPGPAATARLIICEDLADLSRKAADFLVDSLKKNTFHLVLSGGSTPRALHQRLATKQVDWSTVHFFWGDERCVPPEDPDSNFRMAWETLLRSIHLPESQIHRMRGELDPEVAAQDYENHLRTFFYGQDIPVFDFIFLGLGDDGHTASLFPHTTAVNIPDRLVVSNVVQKLDSTRLTMTAPLLNRASRIAFLVSGKAKVTALQKVLHGPYEPRECPAQLIRPNSCELYFFVDRAAVDR